MPDLPSPYEREARIVQFRKETNERLVSLLKPGVPITEIAQLLGAEDLIIIEPVKRGQKPVYKFDVQTFIQREIDNGTFLRLPDRFEKLGATLVPPDEGETIQRGSGEGMAEKKTIPRSRYLVEVLTDLNKRYQIVSGTNAPDMVREETYQVFIIPDLEKIVLVNNEEGNATFVVSVDKDEEPADYYRLSKNELRTLGLYKSRQLNYSGSPDQWKISIKQALTNQDKNPQENTSDLEVLRSRLVEVFKSDKDLLDIPYSQREKLRVDNRTLPAIARLFGITGDPRSSIAVLCELGLAVFPESQILKERFRIENLSPEEWRTAVQQKITPGGWLSLTSEQRRAFKVHGRGMQAFAHTFGVKGHVFQSTLTFLNLGLAIFPDNKPIKEALEFEERNPEKWGERIREVTTPEQWLTMNAEGRLTFKVDGLGLTALATIFGVKGSAVSRLEPFYHIGTKLWPDNKEIKNRLDTERRTAEEWRTELQKDLTPAVWLRMTVADRLQYKKDGWGLEAIATKLGMNDYVNSRVIPFLKLGILVFGENILLHTALEREERTSEAWKLVIKQKFTPEEWVNIKAEVRNGLLIDGTGLGALGTIFGIPNAKFRVQFLRLGLLVWPESLLIKEKLEAAEAKK